MHVPALFFSKLCLWKDTATLEPHSPDSRSSQKVQWMAPAQRLDGLESAGGS